MNPLHISLLSMYCSFGILNYLLIRKSSVSKTIDIQLIVFETDLLKLVLTILISIFYEKRFLVIDMIKPDNLRAGVYYAIPSFIYSIYNLLTLYNLHYLDPSTYQVLMQSRIIFTAIFFQTVLKQKLVSRQWCAILLLLFAFVIKHSGKTLSYPVFYISTTVLQALLTSIASTYNERLLKERDDLLIQNGYMYTFGTMFSLIIYLSSQGSIKSDLQSQSLTQLLIVLISAIIGIITSMILKYINNMAKIFAAAIDISFAAPIYAYFLKDSLDQYDYLSCIIVSFSIWLFYYKPALNAGVVEIKDKRSLVEV